MTRTLLEIIGWIGSALVIVSLAQARVLRFRVLNLAGAVLAVVYNVALAIWPFAAMNAIIAVIDVYWLRRLLTERHDPAAYSRGRGRPARTPTSRTCSACTSADIRTFQPSYAVPEGDEPRLAFLVQRDTETVGAVVVRDAGDGSGVVELDYVTPRFRDFTPGEFVYGRSGVFEARGLRRLVAEPDLAPHTTYLRRVGFRPDGDRMVRDLVPAAT